MLALLSFTSDGARSVVDEYTVKEIYEIVDHPSGAVVLTTSESLDQVEQLLVPTRMKEGTYQVSITRKGRNIYVLDNMDYVIETKYCNEYAHRDKALLKVTGSYRGPKKGVLVFD